MTLRKRTMSRTITKMKSFKRGVIRKKIVTILSLSRSSLGRRTLRVTRSGEIKRRINHNRRLKNRSIPRNLLRYSIKMTLRTL